MVLDTALLTLSNIMHISTVKWSNQEKGVAPSPTPRCRTYWKRSLLVTLDYNRELTYMYTFAHYTHTHTHIYIYIYILSSTADCFVVSQLFSVARHVGRLKLGSKLSQLYVRLSIIPFSQQVNHVSLGIIRHYVVASVCLFFRLTGYQSA